MQRAWAGFLLFSVACSGAAGAPASPAPALHSIPSEPIDTVHGPAADEPFDTALVAAEEVELEAVELFGPKEPTWDLDVKSFETHARVQYYIDFFTGDSRDRFEIWLHRLPRYEELIRSTFRAKGLPEDLVYLALIESGYSNTAVSHAAAVGMWQFIASTGRRYSLTIDAWVDDRRDPFLATEAAAEHLADLHERFGSYYLAAAAYNAGETRIRRSIARLPGASARDSLTDATFFELAASRRLLRRETRDYVPKLIAASLIAKEPERYGFTDIVPMDLLVFDEVSITHPTGLDVLARLADTTVAAMLELNPQFVRGITPPDRSAVVRVPLGRGPLVADRYVSLPSSDRITRMVHYVRRGQTLSGIANQYGVSLSMVLTANRGVDPQRLRVGQRVVIPTSGRIVPASAWSSSGPPPTYRSNRANYRVRNGDTMSDIAQRYRVRLSSLLRYNGMRTRDIIRPGQVIRIPR